MFWDKTNRYTVFVCLLTAQKVIFYSWKCIIWQNSPVLSDIPTFLDNTLQMYEVKPIFMTNKNLWQLPEMCWRMLPWVTRKRQCNSLCISAQIPAHQDPFLRSMAHWVLEDYSRALDTLLEQPANSNSSGSTGNTADTGKSMLQYCSSDSGVSEAETLRAPPALVGLVLIGV